MNIFQRVSYAGKVLLNSNSHLPNDVERVGHEHLIDEQEKYREDAVDFVDDVPSKVRRTVKNRRFATRDPQVAGILTDIMTKANGVFTICGDNERIVKYLEEFAENIDLDNLIDEIIYKGCVDGTGYLNTRVVENHIIPRWLFYDGEDYDIAEIYDKDGELVKIIQKVDENVISNKNSIIDTITEAKVPKDYKYDPDELIIIRFLERDGKSNPIVNNILDDVYFKRTLKKLMPVIVFKNSAIMKVNMGTSTNPNATLNEDDRRAIADVFNNYHLKGAAILPAGIDANIIGGKTLPDVPSYLKYYEKCIYVGMNTPEAVFSSESSNRATADIQLDSPSSGRVLFLQYIQEWVKKYIKELFKRELELQGINGEGWIEFDSFFNEEEEEIEEELNLHKPIIKKGQEEEAGKPTKIEKSSSVNGETINHDVPKTTNNPSRLVS